MKLRKKLLLWLITCLAGSSISTATSWAFNKDRCRARFPGLFHSGWGLFATTHPDQSFSYLSQSSSSWGECSFIGKSEQREVFIAVNTDNIMLDSARGRGEYIDALAVLSGCDSEVARKILGTALQKNFEIIYMDGQRVAPSEVVGTRIDKLISSQPELQKACKLSS